MIANKKVAFYTLGCKLNFSETSTIARNFVNEGFERVEFKADSRNEQSRRGMEGIGATFEGTLRSHTLMTDGFRRSTVYYSILKEEWPEIKARVFSSQG